MADGPSLLNILLFWMNSGTAPATAVTAVAGSAGARGRKAAETFLDSLVETLSKIAYAATLGGGWDKQRDVLLANMEKTFDSFGVGMSEKEKLDRLGRTYLETMIEQFNGMLFGQMFGGKSKADFPFVKFWTEHDEAVCEDCKPLDGAIFDKTDQHLPFILPELHMNCRCWIEELSKMEAANEAQRLEPSAYKFWNNVDEDYRYDKREEQEVQL